MDKLLAKSLYDRFFTLSETCFNACTCEAKFLTSAKSEFTSFFAKFKFVQFDFYLM